MLSSVSKAKLDCAKRSLRSPAKSVGIIPARVVAHADGEVIELGREGVEHLLEAMGRGVLFELPEAVHDDLAADDVLHAQNGRRHHHYRQNQSEPPPERRSRTRSRPGQGCARD